MWERPDSPYLAWRIALVLQQGATLDDFILDDQSKQHTYGNFTIQERGALSPSDGGEAPS